MLENYSGHVFRSPHFILLYGERSDLTPEKVDAQFRFEILSGEVTQFSDVNSNK